MVKLKRNDLVSPKRNQWSIPPEFPYRAVTGTGEVYWGMTKDFARRSIQHGKRFPIIDEIYKNIRTKTAARGLEQLQINAADGIKNLENMINGIRANNPKIGTYLKEAQEYLNSLK